MAVAEITAGESSLSSDKTLAPFLASTFDPAAFLNAQLPTSWTPSSGPSSRSSSTTASTAQSKPSSSAPSSSAPSSNAPSSNAPSLADLNAQAQSLSSQLAAQLSRLSTLLTRLSDDVLRAGGRLAYEVEVLRGDTIGLTDALTSDLRPHLARFGLDMPAQAAQSADSALSPTLSRQQSNQRRRRSRHLSTASASANGVSDSAPEPPSAQDKDSAAPAPQPESPATAQLRRLQTLVTVRDRLDSVVQVFGAATEWAIAPSDVSITASIISVTGPSTGGGASGASDAEVREKRGKEFAERTRLQVTEMLGAGADDEGLAKALARVEQLRALAKIWEGTAEERARGRFVDSLARMVDEKRRAVKGSGAAAGSGYSLTTADSRARAGSGRR